MVDIKSIISLGCVVLIVVAFVIMVFSWFGIMINATVLHNTKPNTRLFKDLLENPFHAIFRPEFLTNEGLLARRRLLKSAAVFLISSLVGYFCFSYIGLL